MAANQSQTVRLSKRQGQAARLRVEAYHQGKLADLIKPVREALDAFDKGKIDIFELDYTIQVYCTQSKELYNFVNTYYGSNSKLPVLLQVIDAEERGEESGNLKDN